jgi:hypothetical protein
LIEPEPDLRLAEHMLAVTCSAKTCPASRSIADSTFATGWLAVVLGLTWSGVHRSHSLATVPRMKGDNIAM